MKLQSIDIAGFRGFAGRQRFDLSADATVIVGSNGIGKTSLLDAIMWGLCGRVPRLGTDDKLVSLYSESGEARVSIQLSNSATSQCLVTRTSDGKTQSVQVGIDGKEYKGLSASARLCEMLWPEAVLASNGEDALGSALGRSVYLQQDRIREFLDATTDQQRFNVVCELIGAGRLTELQSQLERERRSWSKATNQREKDKAPAVAHVNELERQLESLTQSLKVDVQDGDSWAEWWKAITALGVATPSIPAADAVDASSVLDRSLRQLQDLNGREEARLSAAKRLRAYFGQRPAPPAAQISDLRAARDKAEQVAREARESVEAEKKRAAELRRRQIEQQDREQQRRAFAQIALKLLDKTCPVCAQHYDIEESRRRLEELAHGSVTGEMVATTKGESEMNKLAAEELSAVKAASEARNLLASEEDKERRIEEWNTALERECAAFGIPRANISETIVEGLVSECNDRLTAIAKHLRTGERLALNTARAAAQSRASTVKQDIVAAKRELLIQETEIAARTKTGLVLDELIEALRGASSKVAIDRLEQIEPFLQRVYSRIDPHPAFRVVKLVTHLNQGKGRLNAEIHDNEEELSSSDPSSVLSSSQLNALAVSLFLSFNLSLPALPIDAALLDDPIQSLDDIRLLGVVDLLRRTKMRRQLLIATHDQRFGKLLARKLRPTSDNTRTSVIELRGWTRKGPEVTQYDVPPETQPLRLIRAG
jgi:RecF/RecN/SMC N terminal domain.